tara:strand:+ start:165 stop:1622 length:1458 start_codon:yes stop_codon:yes gene_type:complete
MIRFKQFIVEADTSSATNAEMAICYQYNMLKFNDHDEALSKAGIPVNKFKKVTPDLLAIGLNVAKQMEDRGSHLVHSGSGSATNFYKGGRDNTPKADFTGDTKNYISLKKAGETGGSGAQLMSAKSAEAAGVVSAGIIHMESNTKQKVGNNPDFVKAMDILENKMLETARNDLNVEVSKGKVDFIEWYISRSSRAVQLKKKYTFDSVERHLKAELSLLGATRANKSAGKNLLPLEKPLKKSQLKIYKKEYENDTSWKVGDVEVSWEHLTNVSPEKLKDPALKKQITDVIQTSVNSTEWQTELTKFFNNNEELKKWIVYEAGSGLYKFTGESSSKTSYHGSESAVANKILVFNDNGIDHEEDMMKWSMANSNLVNKIDISYKGSGRSKYIKLGLAAHYEMELPLLQEELIKLETSYMLSEGIFSWVKDKAKTFMNKVKDIIKMFYEKIIKKFIMGIRRIAEKGVSVLLETLNIEIEPTVVMSTPKW